MIYKLLRVFLVIILSCLFINSRVHAGEIVLSGKSVDWANSEIAFYRYKELITYSEELLAKTVISDDGTFKLTFRVNETSYIFTHLGIYLAYLYAEPGKEYELVLPPVKEKTSSDYLNPYFQETEIQMGIINIREDDINIQIRMFDDMYEPYYDKHVIESVEGKNFARLDEDISHIESHFAKNTNKYFRQYREYKYAYLRYLSLQHNVTTVSNLLFARKPVLYNNMAYMDLFNQVFKDYFYYHGRTDEGEKIYQDINKDKNYEELKVTLRENKLFAGDTLLELVILKCLFDEFYKDRFSRSGILVVLDSLISETDIREDKLIGLVIRNKITRLLSGFPPPSFELYDLDSNLVSLEDFKGKYVYLNFCSCASYTCLKDFDAIQGIYARHKNRLAVVTITVDFYDETLKKFLMNKEYNWEFLFYSHQPDVLKEYDIRAFPTYFLIGPDGKLILSPAPAPGENFESKLFEVMRSRGDL